MKANNGFQITLGTWLELRLSLSLHMWPSPVTSIVQFEYDPLRCADASSVEPSAIFPSLEAAVHFTLRPLRCLGLVRVQSEEALQVLHGRSSISSAQAAWWLLGRTSSGTKSAFDISGKPCVGEASPVDLACGVCGALTPSAHIGSRPRVWTRFPSGEVRLASCDHAHRKLLMMNENSTHR